MVAAGLHGMGWWDGGVRVTAAAGGLDTSQHRGGEVACRPPLSPPSPVTELSACGWAAGGGQTKLQIGCVGK